MTAILFMIVFFVIGGLAFYGTIKLAQKKSKNVPLWILMSIIFSPFATITVLFFKQTAINVRVINN